MESCLRRRTGCAVVGVVEAHSAADDGFLVEGIRKTPTRAKLEIDRRKRRARVSIDAGKGDTAEERAADGKRGSTDQAADRVHVRAIEGIHLAILAIDAAVDGLIPAQTQINDKIRAHLPVILEKCSAVFKRIVVVRLGGSVA